MATIDVAATQAISPKTTVGACGELEVSTALVRGFLEIAEDELVELTAFVNSKAWVCQCIGQDAHVDALRLMSAPGTWKRKGTDTPERPHRLTSFSCCGSVARVRLGDLI